MARAEAVETVASPVTAVVVVMEAPVKLAPIQTPSVPTEMTAAQEVPAATEETADAADQEPAMRWPDRTVMAALAGMGAAEESVDSGVTAIAAAPAVTRTAAMAVTAVTAAAAAEAGLAARA